MRFFFLIALFSLPFAAFAQETFVPLTNLPNIATVGNEDSLPTFFNTLYKLCIGAAAVIAVIQIMRAGTKFFFSTGSVAQNQEAKKLITNSILGLLLVLSPAIVFGIINPDILNLDLDISRLELGEISPQNISTSTQRNATTTGSGSSINSANNEYEVRVRLLNQLGGFVGVRSRRFPNKQQCDAYFATVSAEMQQNNWELDDNYEDCNCSQPRSAFPACRN